ncbi:MAG: 16S rRNA (cytosine(967)-C(5))-methyltransferase RsmB [Fidelibacterota bacterium]|nr:MAG: 16S rRNA (cytosine(967)-C(5))-methyltransferase RsmB [Candidatus Neomarinimicrobiota bacterium]
MIDEARKIAFRVLSRPAKVGRINDTLHQTLSNTSLSSREKRFTTELVMGTTRMKRRLDADLAACYRSRYDHMQREVKWLLRLGAYQLHYMDGVPPHAALSATADLARNVNLARAVKLVNGVLRELQRRDHAGVFPAEATPDELATAFSHPTWLVERWLEHWGRERTVDLMEWNNRRPTIWFRQRKDATHQQRLAQWAQSRDLTLEAHSRLPDYFAATDTPAALLEPAVMEQGLFIVQDPASGAIVNAVDPQPGEVILDLCAGPGGKTAALADCVGPTGRILAYEIDHQRVKQINSTLNRLGLENVDILPGDATSRPLMEADKILIDAPCTGTGVMARRADLRWRRQPQHLTELSSLQMTLLEHAARHLRPGATLVYATCSLEPEENWDLVQKFQERNQNTYLAPMPSAVPPVWLNDNGALQTFPPDHHVDGLFAVRLQVS